MSLKFCVIIESNPKKAFFAIVLHTNMATVTSRENLELTQPRSQGLSSLPPLVVGTETLVAAGHVTIYPSKTAGWVGTQVHLVERTIKYHSVAPPFQQIFLPPRFLGGHVTSRDQGLCSNDYGRQRRDPGNEVGINHHQTRKIGP